MHIYISPIHQAPSSKSSPEWRGLWAMKGTHNNSSDWSAQSLGKYLQEFGRGSMDMNTIYGEGSETFMAITSALPFLSLPLFSACVV